ncbi:MAG TPA: DMT family transporter [Anaerolineales bacterium]|nr:DMT family transporter [Anaerolineales bacterium]
MPAKDDLVIPPPAASTFSRSNIAADWSGTPTSDRLVGAALCTLSAAGFASLSILGKLAFQLGLSLVTILSLRFIGASVLLALYLKVVLRRRLFHGWRLTLPLILLGSIGYAGQSTLYFASLERNPASINSLLLYVYPIFVALLSWILYRKSPSPKELAAMVLAGTGVVLTVSGDSLMRSLSSMVDPLGVALVLGSAAWYAVYIIVSDRYVHTAGPWVSTTWIAFGAGISFSLAAFLGRSFEINLTGETLSILLSMVLLSTILALGTFLAGMRRVGPTAASLLSTLEPVFTVVLALLFLHERLSLLQLLGGALVLSAVILLTLPHRVSSSS